MIRIQRVTNIFGTEQLSASTTNDKKLPLEGDESIMSPKEHGSSETPVQKNLRWGCHHIMADRLCNYNRHYVEPNGYYRKTTSFMKYVKNLKEGEKIVFYDSNSGNRLFLAPRGRSMRDFLQESKSHGLPCFRDDEVNWENVRCLRNGETVSLNGTHLGYNIPDNKGNCYRINLVSIAGNCRIC